MCVTVCAFVFFTQLLLRKWTGMTLLLWKLWILKTVKQVRQLEMPCARILSCGQKAGFLQ